MEEEKRKEMYQKIIQQFFMQFDRFLIHQWSGRECKEPFSEEDRKEAYLNFYKRVKRDKIANRQTIRKWFGLDGFSLPGRGQIFRIAFSLGLSPEQTEEYLQYGISEPGFQVNDYSEYIAMYCLDHGFNQETYLEMVEFFEQHSPRNVQLEQTAHTERLRQEYHRLSGLSKEEFLLWMCKNAALFKGYSMTTYRFFTSLMEEALALFRNEIRETLFLALEDTDFFLWAKEQGISEEEYGPAIRRYMKNLQRRKNNPITVEKQQEIKRLLVMGYSSKNRVCDLLTELYMPMNFEKCGMDESMRKALQKEIGNVNAKYVSELLGVSLHKEKMIRLNHAMTELKHMPDEDTCPDWIAKLIFPESAEVAATAETIATAGAETVETAKKVLKRHRVLQEQRVRNIRRADLLILIQYICQKRYLEKISEEGDPYSGSEAKEDFIQKSNTILESCGMREISSEYRLDYILLSCFDEEGVLFAEVFEES